MFKRSKRLNPPLASSVIPAKALGAHAEQLACDWLIKRGLVLKDRNFRTKYGEIDLIMQGGNCLIFVEVRYRKNSNYGSAEESVTAKKCQRLKAAAQGYLLAKGYDSNTAIKFDVLAISPSSESDLHYTMNWIQNILS